MLYRLKVHFLKRYSFFQKVRSKLKKIFDAQQEISNIDLVKKYSNGKSFADIGALWGVDGLNSFIAEENGATRVVAVDVYPPSEKFIQIKKERNSKVEFVEGDINLMETTHKIQSCDVVLCSGVLYHTPDPLHMLTRLRSITNEILILNTASIPELHGVRNVAIFYPFLPINQRKIWNRGIGSQKAITGQYEPLEGYGNWFWGMTPSCIISMLQCAGFEVIEKHITAFNSIFICQAVSIKFKASSGEWNTPKDESYRALRR
jgi:SAM-dependent methyltransferase